MPTNTDLSEARDKHPHAESLKLLLSVIGTTPSGFLSMVDDEKTRRAVKAAREAAAQPQPAAPAGDDGVVVDEAWLLAVGGMRDEHPRKITFFRPSGMSIGFWDVDDGWKAMLIHSEHHQSCIVRGLKTRGDVRRLCSALGIPLNEPAALAPLPAVAATQSLTACASPESRATPSGGACEASEPTLGSVIGERLTKFADEADAAAGERIEE